MERRGRRNCRPRFTYETKMKKKIYRIISVVSLIMMVGAVLSLLYTLYLYQRSNREYLALSRSAHLQTAAEAEPVAAAEETESEPGAETETEEGPELHAVIPIDFPYLKTVNEDIVGWVEVEGTPIDYPVLFDTTDFMYYLNHNHARAYTPYGSVFMLSYNSPDFTDFNTVIYGHNIVDGGMFGALHDFEDQEFFDTNKLILVYTPERRLVYQIFAAYRTDNLDQIQNFDLETPEGRQEYIDRIYTHDTKAIFDPEITVTPDDRIITLSTCIANYAYRYLVQGVLIMDEEAISVAAPQN